MLGDALLVHPCLEPNSTSVTAYFPDDTWYNFHTGELVTTSAGYITLDASWDKPINVHVRPGVIIPWLNSYETAESLPNFTSSNISLLIVAKNGRASGKMYVDDGETIDSESSMFNFEFGPDPEDPAKMNVDITFD
jgi:alpha-glucosidase